MVFICVPWQILWFSWADINDFAIDGCCFLGNYEGVVYMVGGGMSLCLKIVGSYSCRVDLYRGMVREVVPLVLTDIYLFDSEYDVMC
jgi:hypothetical protein